MILINEFNRSINSFTYFFMKTNHTILVLILAFLPVETAAQRDYGTYYTCLLMKLRQPTVPQIADRAVSLSDFRVVGDGATLCTEAFSRAIKKLAAEDVGHLKVPDGIWLTEPIELLSGIDRGGRTHNVFCSDIYMSNIVGEAIIFENTYVNKDVRFMMGGDTDIDSTHLSLPDFSDEHISIVVCHEAEAGILMRGIPQANIHDLTPDNITISGACKPTELSYTRSIRMTNIRVNGKEVENLP